MKLLCICLYICFNLLTEYEFCYIMYLQERHADNCIGNVTGSNSVNVFLGLGMPWLIAAIYWKVKVRNINHFMYLIINMIVFLTCILTISLLFSNDKIQGYYISKINFEMFLVKLKFPCTVRFNCLWFGFVFNMRCFMLANISAQKEYKMVW